MKAKLREVNMNKRYKKLVLASLPVILVGGIITGAAVPGKVLAAETNKLHTAQAKEKSTKDIGLSAGVGRFMDQLLAQSGEQPTEPRKSGQQVTKLSTADEAAEESEYSNLAIADVNDYVNVRSTPDTGGEIVGKMYDDSVAQILSVVGEGDEEWFQVISGSVEGYIKSEYFIYGDAAAAVIDDYVTKYVVVKADRLNVRTAPDITAKRIGYMDNGEKGELLEAGKEWMKVLYTEGKEGYVSAEYVTIEEQYTYAKSIEEERKELEAQRLLAQRTQESETVAPENKTIQVTPPPTNYANVSELRTAIVNYAMQYLGNRYIMGGQSLVGGTDCSGFTSYTYAAFGYSLSRTPQGQWGSNGRYISVEEAQPGDIVCYSSSGGRCTHVGLYIGDGKIIHSANSRKGVIISNIYYDNTFIGIKNVID